METPEHNTEQSANSEELVSLIKAQLQEKDNQIERLQQLLAIEKDQTQQLLERQLLPFWKRRRRKQLPEPGTTE